MWIAIPYPLKYPEHGMLDILRTMNNENYEPPPRDDGACLAAVAAANETGMISSIVNSVPNQPVHFYNDPTFKRRQEDDVIAWTWRTFLDSPEPSDPTVIERMPMTKAAKRALDTITAVAKLRVPESNVQKFIVTGASKRGWTTWSLAAVDKRVVAIAPQVFSLLNMENGTLFQHNQNMDGAWSFAFRPYWSVNLTREFYNLKTRRIYEVEDMIYYKERFTIPVLSIGATGDEFFLLDDFLWWWDDIPDPKWLMMLPNAEHSMAPHYVQIAQTIKQFAISVAENIPMPKVSWTMGETSTGGYVRFVTDPPPLSLKAFWAVTQQNDTRRDFRLFILNEETGETVPHAVVWRQNLEIIDEGNGVYYVEANAVENRWVGLFIEGTWEGPTGGRMVFTSQCNMIPNTYPRHRCTDNDDCYGRLV